MCTANCYCTDNGDREEPRRQGHDLAAASGESGKDGVLGSVRLRAGPSVPTSVVEMSVFTTGVSVTFLFVVSISVCL